MNCLKNIYIKKGDLNNELLKVLYFVFEMYALFFRGYTTLIFLAFKHFHTNLYINVF